jgi:hypothetical protein
MTCCLSLSMSGCWTTTAAAPPSVWLASAYWPRPVKLASVSFLLAGSVWFCASVSFLATVSFYSYGTVWFYWASAAAAWDWLMNLSTLFSWRINAAIWVSRLSKRDCTARCLPVTRAKSVLACSMNLSTSPFRLLRSSQTTPRPHLPVSGVRLLS